MEGTNRIFLAAFLFAMIRLLQAFLHQQLINSIYMENTVSLLNTKLYLPSLRANHVPRTHLIRQLDDGLKHPFTLISAPAGYGKTTLFSAWYSGLGKNRPVAWVSLDEGDNDLARFLLYVTASLNKMQDKLAAKTASLLQGSQLPPTESIITTLLNEIDVFRQDFVLVLDDYHVIHDQNIHRAVRFALEHQPACLHLVILTRADPPLPLSQLRVKDRISQIRARDLRFNLDETDLFFRKVMGLELEKEDVAALDERSEGWIAALQLAALSLRGREDKHDFVAAFTGSHHYVVDYLVEEVIDRQDEQTRIFLMRTAVLERMNAALCNQITGNGDGQHMLETLERDNLFVTMLDDERRWYRYHPLFSSILRNILQNTSPGEAERLHILASRWFEDNGFPYEAVQHALEGKSYADAARQLKDCWSQLASGNMLPADFSPGTFLKFIDSIPAKLLQSDPGLSMIYTYNLWSSGKRDLLEPYLENARRNLAQRLEAGEITSDDPDYRSMLARIDTFQSLVESARGRLDLALELANRAVSFSQPEARSAAALAYIGLYYAYRELGYIEKGIETCRLALPIARAAGNPGLVVDATCGLGLMLLVQGRLHAADEVFRDGFEFASASGQDWTPRYGIMFVAYSDVPYAWNQLDLAEENIKEGISLSDLGRLQLIKMFAQIFLARLWHARGEHLRALELLQEAELATREAGVNAIHVELSSYLARLQAELGYYNEASQWLEELDLTVGERLGFLEGMQKIHAAHALVSLDRHDEALELAAGIEAAAERSGSLARQIEALVIQAVIWQKRGEEQQAVSCLERALLLGEREGFMRVFLDEGREMKNLLGRLRSRLISQPDCFIEGKKQGLLNYVERLLVAFQLQSVSSPSASHAGKEVESYKLIEALSERELEVLRLIAAGKSNREIAEALVLAVGTVKKHISNIFGKLGVSSRTQCVARARQLHLL
jgi:LuxR family maltose regulon positive regulatory protein